MSFNWLQMRISEEQDRRQKEKDILERLPAVLDEVHQALVECVESYGEAFGKESIEITYLPHKIRVTVREEQQAKWDKNARKVEVTTAPQPPSVHIDRNGEMYDIGVGVLPGDRIFYKDGDKFLTMEDVTRHVLDATLFPKLKETP